MPSPPWKKVGSSLDLETGAVAPPVDLKRVPKGLNTSLRPDFSIAFKLDSIPESGAAFVLGVEDTDAAVTSLGVFVNGLFAGMPQVLGYDRVPGGRLTNKAIVVTIPKERFQAGTNTVSLRLLPDYYPKSEPSIDPTHVPPDMLGLGDKSQCPYEGPWVLWNSLALYRLPRPISSPVDGHPVWMGANCNGNSRDDPDWQKYILRDYGYLGLVGIDAPMFLRADLRCLKTHRRLDPGRKKLGRHRPHFP